VKEKKDMKPYAIKQYLITIIFLVMVIGFFSILYANSNRIITERQDDYLSLENQLMEKEVEAFFREKALAVEHIASYVKTHGQDGLQEVMADIFNNQSKMSSLYYLSKNNEMVHASGFVPPAHIDFTTRIWYQQALTVNGITHSPAFVNSTQDKIIVTISYAVYQDNLFLGVVAADIDIQIIQQFLTEKVIGKTGYVLLIDKNNHLLCHLFEDSVSVMSFTDISSEPLNLSGSGTIDSFVVNNEVGVVKYKTIINDQYTLLTFMPHEEYFSATTLFTNIFVILSLVILIMGIAHMNFNQKHIFNPFKVLIRDIEKIDVINHLDYRLNTKMSGFLPIREGLNKVLSTSQDYFVENQMNQRKLLYENQRTKLLMNSTADIIFEIDKKMKYVSVFGKGLNKIHLTSDYFKGKHVLEIFGNKAQERAEIYKDALKGESKVYQWDILINQERIYFETAIAPIYDEFDEVVGAVGISRDITETKKRQDEIDFVSTHDYLTGLYNRRKFNEILKTMDTKEYYPIGIMNLDLNGLKILNDAYGHDQGDIALKQIGELLLKHINSGSVVARMGGDEFAAIVPNTSYEHMYEIKNRIKQVINEVYVKNIQLSIAVGYELKKDEAEDIEDILKKSENHMYRNKLAEGMSVRNHSIRAIHKTLTEKYDEERIHSEKVSQLCKTMGKALGIKDENLKELEMAGMYHDIGKISIPDVILNKPSKLTAEEYEFIKSHTESGYQILRAADEYTNLAEYALSHHERWDGKGYPKGLKEDTIPLYSRIIAVADAYEAMTSDRVYRKKMTKDQAIEELITHAGTQFDPYLVPVFIKMINEE